MTIEANVVLAWPLTGMANRLRRHPSEVQKLQAFKAALDRICQSRMTILDASATTLQNATGICQQLGHLINDACMVALMRQHALTRLASHDADFDRVPAITRFAPA